MISHRNFGPLRSAEGQHESGPYPEVASPRVSPADLITRINAPKPAQKGQPIGLPADAAAAAGLVN